VKKRHGGGDRNLRTLGLRLQAALNVNILSPTDI
jgi:hypothetical protein